MYVMFCSPQISTAKISWKCKTDPDDVIIFEAGTLKTCHAIHTDARHKDTHVILFLAGCKQPISVRARDIRVLLTPHQPDFSVDMWLVGHGYQAEYYIDGKLAEIECRDFGGTHQIKKLVKWLYRNFAEMLAKMRKEH